MRNKILFPVYFILGTMFSYSQPVYKLDLGGRLTYGISSTQDGGSLVVSFAGDSIPDAGAATIIKLTATGDTVFSKFFGTNSNFLAVREIHDHGIIAAGLIDTSSHGMIYNPYIVRTDSLGNLLWSRQSSGLNYEGFVDVIETLDHGFFAVGNAETGSPAENDILLVKFDSVGTVVWSKTLDMPSDDLAGSAVELWNGNLVVSGATYSIGAGGRDLLLMMLDPLGNVIWQEAIGSSDYDSPLGVVQAEDSTIVFSAVSGSDIYLSKVDLSGSLLWTKTYDSGKNDQGGSLIKTLDHGYSITGAAVSGIHNQTFLLHTDSAGNFLWAKSYDDTISYYVQIQLTQNKDGGYVFCKQKGMYAIASGPGDVTKTDSLGNSCYSGPASFTVSPGTWTVTPCSMTVGSFPPFSSGPGITYVSGTTNSLICASATGVEEREKVSSILSVYPNPTNGEFRLSFSSPTVGMTLVLTNLLGQKVFRAAIHQEEEVFSVSQLPTGIYSLRLLSAKRLEGSSLISVAH